jgi:hypothetical protein
LLAVIAFVLLFLALAGPPMTAEPASPWPEPSPAVTASHRSPDPAPLAMVQWDPIMAKSRRAGENGPLCRVRGRFGAPPPYVS